MTDILKRLRDQEMFFPDLYSEAADEIEQNRIDLEEYRRDVERLRAALREISGDNWFFIEDAKNYARAALEGK